MSAIVVNEGTLGDPMNALVYREEAPLNRWSQFIQRIADFYICHAGLGALLRRSRMAAVATQRLGEPTVLFKAKTHFDTVGRAGIEARLHQRAGWSKYAPLFWTAMVAINAASEENGCLLRAKTPRVTRSLGTEWNPSHENGVAT